MSFFRNAQYEISATRWQELPKPSLPEIAFAGRSNAGKSSAINAITRSRIARISKTPGRTRMINLFRVAGGAYLADLPGYGFAKVAATEREQWRLLIERYLAQRASLVALVLIMDSRHPLTPLDRQLLEWFRGTGKPVHVLLTKADKLSRQQASATARGVLADLNKTGIPATVQLFSALSGQGTAEAEDTLARLLGWDGVVNEKTKPPVKGEKTGGQNALTSVKAPAQGGEAGDGSSPSAAKISRREKSSQRVF